MSRSGAKISTVELEDSVSVDIESSQAGKMETQKQESEDVTDLPVIPEGPSKVELKATSCPVSNVTVFLDRAEVNRVVETRIEGTEAEVIIKGLPSVIDENSVR